MIKVEAEGLKPFTQYYYQFSVCDSDNKSPMGRTKTSPAEDDDVSEIDFAVFSCSNFRKLQSRIPWVKESKSSQLDS